MPCRAVHTFNRWQTFAEIQTIHIFYVILFFFAVVVLFCIFVFFFVFCYVAFLFVIFRLKFTRNVHINMFYYNSLWVVELHAHSNRPHFGWSARFPDIFNFFFFVFSLAFKFRFWLLVFIFNRWTKPERKENDLKLIHSPAHYSVCLVIFQL